MMGFYQYQFTFALMLFGQCPAGSLGFFFLLFKLKFRQFCNRQGQTLKVSAVVAISAADGRLELQQQSTETL